MYGKRDQTRSDHLAQVANWRAMNPLTRPEADAETGAEPGTGQVDDGKDALGADIAQFVAMTRTGPWLLAYLVARRIAPGEGNGVGFEQQSTKCFGRNTFRRISRAGVRPPGRDQCQAGHGPTGGLEPVGRRPGSGLGTRSPKEP
ncbi:hypothetical protein [Nonomuraea jabiensis]|uniref:DUF4158 domain-containing protein n=1 Tax=Nonomuraea jabiensis TaxID=882448 RepID=A0A7W9GE28_9ACTN|nr:hypothetical protein [Nonomuraea jabiensis]MBB5782109.1 hypothetical protein [Nonomuraea jabiensis]